MINFKDLLQHDVGKQILTSLIYEDDKIVRNNIHYLKNLCKAIPELYKFPEYQELFIKPSNKILKTHRYFIGMTEKMKLVSYDMHDDGYFDYQNIIYMGDQNVGISRQLTISTLNDYILYNINIPDEIKFIIRNKMYGIAVEASSFTDSIFEYLEEIRWIDIQKNITNFSKTQRLNLINYFDYEFSKTTSDIIEIEEYKQILIKHLYPNNLLEKEMNSYTDDY